ncbi:PIG-P-domain-containing protein [Multifurca ochricompacta]|uniref:PIG-P-domain-containing protein n=1 Tax=Multifurca ochricompacta TaxID=376703 RepID=A0AAD4QKK0_9AGAM|nr:PIG-P-domain-containing protein [Multifurca ochricompacta]
MSEAKLHGEASSNSEDEPTSPVSPLARFPPLPSLESRSLAPEFYGFVAWAVTYLLFVLYVLWAILPDEWIIWLGVTWYPNREWALLVPAWTIIAVLLTYFSYFSMAIRGTPTFSENCTYTGTIQFKPRAQYPDVCWPNPYLKYARLDAIPEAYDLPIGLVNRVLYDSNGSTT